MLKFWIHLYAMNNTVNFYRLMGWKTHLSIPTLAHALEKRNINFCEATHTPNEMHRLWDIRILSDLSIFSVTLHFGPRPLPILGDTYPSSGFEKYLYNLLIIVY